MQGNPNDIRRKPLEESEDPFNRSRKKIQITSHNEDMVMISGSSNSELAEGIASKLGTKLGKCTVGKFADGETKI